MTERRHYSAEQRSEAVGLAVSVGIREAGRRLGISHRTISHWLARPEAQVLVAASREDILEIATTAAVLGVRTLVNVLSDPHAADRDKVRAAEVALDRYQLMSGGVTERTANLNIQADGWGSERYVQADPETREQAQTFLREAMDEVLVGTQALRLAGASESGMQLDGLKVRANLSDSDARSVRMLLAQLEGALAAGVDASDIIGALTARRIGDGDG